MPKDSTAATQLRSLRTALGMTQEELASELKVSQSVVTAWEGGHYPPSVENYVALGYLADKHGLHSESGWCFEAATTRGTALLAATAYRQGYIEAESVFPEEDQGVERHRYALRFQKRILRRKAKKKE